MSWSFSSCGEPANVKHQAALQFGQPYYATMRQPEQATIRAVQQIIEATCDGARKGATITVTAFGSQTWHDDDDSNRANQSVSLNITTSGG